MRTLKLASGHAMPQVGLGTWELASADAIRGAIGLGYRAVDTALVYATQTHVGDAVASAIKDGVVQRSDMFLTTKLWNNAHSRPRVAESVELMLRELRTSYIDLLLMHWPTGYKEDGPISGSMEEMVPKDADGRPMDSGVDFLDTWAAMAESVKVGKVRSIGVSNFNEQQLQRILDWTASTKSAVPLSMNQVELHPYLRQTELVEFCRAAGIGVTAYASLGSRGSRYRRPEWPLLLEDDVVAQVANELGRSPGQVLLRWAFERDIFLIPKSASAERQSQNIRVEDFQLRPAQTRRLDALHRPLRMFPCDRDKGHHPEYPF